MKTCFLFLLFCFLNNVALIAQDGEISSTFDRMAKELIVKIKTNNPGIKDVTVMDFSMNNRASSSLESHLSTLFAFSLEGLATNKLTLIDKDNLKTKNPVSFGEIMNFVGSLYSDPNTSNQSQGNETNNVVKNKSLEKSFKGIDALFIGTITELSNAYQLVIKVIENGNGKVVGSALGKINKTPDLVELSRVGKASSKPQTNSLYRKDHLLYTLNGCRQVGSNIECDLVITNEGNTDTELYIYDDNSRSISQSTGNEYKVSGLKLADKTNSKEVHKTIVAQSTVNALVSFSNFSESVTTLSKVEIKCWANNIGYFISEFRGVNLY